MEGLGPGLHSSLTLNTGPYCLRQCCAALGNDIRSTSSRLPMSHTGGGPAVVPQSPRSRTAIMPQCYG